MAGIDYVEELGVPKGGIRICKILGCRGIMRMA